MAAPQVPGDPIAAARANATRPFKGRLVLTMWRDFTMGPLGENSSMRSQIKSSRPIGDRLARQIEQHCGKPIDWMDEERVVETPTAAELQFLELALRAWRTTNAAGRKALREHMKKVAG